MFTHSIRGRLLLWLGFWLGCILAGFWVTAYQLTRLNQLARIDEAIDRRTTALQADFRRQRPPPNFGRGPRGPDERGPFRTDRDGLGAPARNDAPPGAEPAPPPDPQPAGTAPPPDSLERTGNPPTLTRDRPPFSLHSFIPNGETAALFTGAEGGGFYYAIWNRDGSVQSWSGAAPSDLKLPAPNAAGRTFRQLRGEFREAYYFTERGDCILVGTSAAPGLRAVHRTGRLLAAAGLAVLLLGMAGGAIIINQALRPIGAIAETAGRVAGGDLSGRVPVEDPRSELGRLAGVLNSTFSRLESAFAEQRQFTADASHELRTPLSVLIMETQTALNRERSGEDYRAALATVLETAQQMRGLTESLLELARWDAGQHALRSDVLDLAEIARVESERLAPIAGRKEVRFVLDCQAAPATGDGGQLARVIGNVLQNAVRHTPPSGTVRVRTGTEKTRACVTITDTGPGIARADLPRIFERFFRADQARTAGDGHSGLGLSIAKSILDAHGGSIEATSPPGEGATFVIRLPLAPAQPPDFRGQSGS